MRAFLPLCLLVLPAVGPGGVDAQVVVPHPGEEVRVVRRGEPGAIFGVLVEATSGAVVVDPRSPPGTITIPRGSITGMSVQRGYRTRALRGALIGFGAGIAGGVVLGQALDTFDGTAVAVGASVGAALPLGLLIGWLVRSPDWDGVDMAALAPSPAGPAAQPRRSR
jgi:hypothetical protein